MPWTVGQILDCVSKHFCCALELDWKHFYHMEKSIFNLWCFSTRSTISEFNVFPTLRETLDESWWIFLFCPNKWNQNKSLFRCWFLVALWFCLKSGLQIQGPPWGLNCSLHHPAFVTLVLLGLMNFVLAILGSVNYRVISKRKLAKLWLDDEPCIVTVILGVQWFHS